MKKLVLRAFIVFFLFLLVVGGWLLMVLHDLPQVDYLSDPGISFELKVPDWQGSYFTFTVGPENPDWVPLDQIPLNLRNAVLSGEDFSFYSHRGIDWFELKESLLKDLRERRLARGASTITQQLAKNIFLSREKTVKRKVREVVLARRMEKALTKDRILELYLNLVELGNRVYGVGAGAYHHFHKPPSKLSLRECAFLAAMLPGPRVYDPAKNPDRVINRSDHLLGVMLKGRMVTEEEYLKALNEIPFAADSQTIGSTLPDSEPESELPVDHEEETASKEAGHLPGDKPALELETPDMNDGIVEIPIE